MHTYSINSPERWRILFFIAVVSIGLGNGLDFILNQYWELGAEYLSIPSAFAIYVGLYALFDKYLWKFKLFSKLGIIETPNFSGTWTGKAQSTLDAFESTYNFTLTVHQTWAKISIILEGDTRVSKSTMAAIEKTNPSFSKIEWGFLSKSKPMSYQDEGMFYGVTRLDLKTDESNKINNEIEGDYYTDRSRETYGKIVLLRD